MVTVPQVADKLAVLPRTFLDAGSQLRVACAARGGRPASSFTAGGRGGLPPDPDAPLVASPFEPSLKQQAATGSPTALTARPTQAAEPVRVAGTPQPILGAPAPPAGDSRLAAPPWPARLLRSLTATLQTTADGAFSLPVQLTAAPLPLADLTVGTRFPLTTVPRGALRYLRLFYTVAGSAPTAGKITAGAGVETVHQDNRSYPARV